MSPSGFRLLPAIYRRLNAAEHEDRYTGRLRGIYRQSWYRNQLLLDRARGVIGSLSEVDVRPVLIRGAAMATTVYDDVGSRPMGDVDIAIPASDRPKVEARLLEQGWRPKSSVPARHRVTASASYVDGDDLELRVHWYLSDAHLYPEAAEPVLRAARPVDASGTAMVLAADPTDLLLLAVLDGRRRRDAPSVQWFADVVTLLQRRGSEIDWARLALVAGDWEVGGSVVTGLTGARRLIDELHLPDAEIPSHAIAMEVRAARSQEIEAWLRARTRPTDPFGTLPLRWFGFRRRERAEGRRPSLRGFSSFLGDVYGADRGTDLLRVLARRGRARVGGFIRRRTPSADQ